MKKQYALERRIPLITAEDLQLEIELDLLDDPSTASKATPFKPNDPDFLFESASARVMQALQPAIARVRYLDSSTRLPDNAEDTLGYTPPEFS